MNMLLMVGMGGECNAHVFNAHVGNELWNALVGSNYISYKCDIMWIT